MKEIKLTQGKVALVDDEDYEHLNFWKWSVRCDSHNCYAARTVYDNGRFFTVRMHRLIMGANSPEIIVDHRDHNGLNNQKVNLRLCNKKQNGSNRRKSKKASSEFLGVHYCNTRKLWVAQLQHNNRPYSAGLHKSETEAAIAYNNKAIELHGEFASLNQIKA